MKEKKKILISITVVVIILVALLTIYITIFDNSKNIFLSAINKEYKKLNDSFEKSLSNNISKASKDKTVASKYKFDFDLDVDNSVIRGSKYKTVIDEINKLNFELNGVTDTKNKKFNYDLKVLSNNNKLINVLAYGKKSSVYFELKDIFNKYIEVPIDEYDKLFEDQSKNIDKIQYISKTIKDEYLNNLDKNDFTKIKTNTYVDGKKIKTNKVTYKLSEKSVLILTKSVLVDLEKNDKFIKECSSLTGKTVKEIKKDIKKAILDMNDEIKDADSDKFVSISIYTKGLFNEAIKYEVKLSENDDTILLTYSNYDNKKIFNVYNGETKILTSKTVLKSKDKYKTTIKIATIDIDIDSILNDNKTSHEISVKNNSTELMKGSLVTTNKEVTKNKKYIGTLKFKLSVVNNGTNLASIGIKGTSDVTIGSKTSIPDLSNSIKYESITSDDYNEMLTNLASNTELTNFINTISNIAE